MTDFGTLIQERTGLGRFSVEITITNHEDIYRAKAGLLPSASVRRMQISGIVDTGASRLVLPSEVVAYLGLPVVGRVSCRLADGRSAEKEIVGLAQVEIQGRSGVFTAVVEPARTDALIGAIVLEELDFVVDPSGQKLVPRDPKGILVEIEAVCAP